jgi:hypothetical protein
MYRAAVPLKSSCELMTGALHVRETRTRGTRVGSGVRLHKESQPHATRAGSAQGTLMSRARQLLLTEPTIEMDASPPVLLSFEVNMPSQQQIETASERPDASRGWGGL